MSLPFPKTKSWNLKISPLKTRNIYIQTNIFLGGDSKCYFLGDVIFSGGTLKKKTQTRFTFRKPRTFTVMWLNGTTILAAPFSNDGPVTTTSRDFSTCHISRRGSIITKQSCYQAHPPGFSYHNVIALHALPPKTTAVFPLVAGGSKFLWM